MKRNHLCTAALVALTVVAATAQAPPTDRPAPSPEPRAPSTPIAPLVLAYDRDTLESVARHLSSRTGERVLLDGTVKGSTPVTLSGEAATLEEALTRITGGLGLSWRKIWLSEKEGTPTGDQARAAARALEALEASGVIVEEPATGKASLWMRGLPAAPDFAAKVKAAWPQMRPYFVISNPKAAARREARREPVANRKNGPATPEDFAALERERMQLFLRLAPDQRAAAMSQAMDLFLQTDPQAMGEMMQAGMQAWLQTMQRMTPEQRQQFVQRSMQMMQSIPPEVWQNIFGMFRPQ